MLELHDMSSGSMPHTARASPMWRDITSEQFWNLDECLSTQDAQLQDARCSAQSARISCREGCERLVHF